MSNERRRVLMLALGTVFSGAVAGQDVPSSPPNIIKIRARRFVFVPDAVQIPLGMATRFELITEDVPMGFSVPDFGVRTTILPGMKASVEVKPTKVGTFTFLCDVFCGTGHEEMSGTITVV